MRLSQAPMVSQYVPEVNRQPPAIKALSPVAMFIDVVEVLGRINKQGSGIDLLPFHLQKLYQYKLPAVD